MSIIFYLFYLFQLLSVWSLIFLWHFILLHSLGWLCFLTTVLCIWVFCIWMWVPNIRSLFAPLGCGKIMTLEEEALVTLPKLQESLPWRSATTAILKDRGSSSFSWMAEKCWMVKWLWFVGNNQMWCFLLEHLCH